jgi:predicted kinase
MAKLLLLRGLPGSGKSTLAKTMDGYRHLEADMYFVSPSGEYKFDPAGIKNAHAWCQDSTRWYLERGENVVVSNTFTKVWEMQPYLDMAKRFRAHVEVRTCTGEYGSVHEVPEETLERMKANWEEYSHIEEVPA